MIESSAFKRILDKLDNIESNFEKLKRESEQSLSEKWFDTETVCKLLNISDRTLIRYREENKIPYSQISRKVYYRAIDIEKFLKKNYKKVRNF